MYGDVVRKAREARGLTQTQLAEISGVEQSNISAIEHGRRQPTAATLHRLLLACGFEVLAVAGDLVVPFPASPDDIAGNAQTDPPTPRNDAERNRMLMAALRASEATLRARKTGSTARRSPGPRHS
jgi:transcriptional regulator with XRE-family HTH domain